MADNLKPLFEQVKKTWEQRDQLRDDLVKNVKEKSSEIETRAWDLARQTKDHRIVTQYVRPFVGSDKAEQALTRLSTIQNPIATKFSAKLEEVRKQYLEVTAPREVNAEIVDTETTTESKKTKKSRKSEN